MGVFLTVAADTCYAGGDEYGAMAPPHCIGRMDRGREKYPAKYRKIPEEIPRNPYVGTGTNSTE